MVRLIPIKTPLLGDHALDFILVKVKKLLRTGDILVITSKVISLQYNGLIALKDVVCTQKAIKLAKEYAISAPFAQLIINESDKILGGVKGAILTLKNGILMANAGIDASNVPLGHLVKLPRNIEKIADEIRLRIKKITGKNIGILISDSVCLPLRWGTHHFALALSGFDGIIDERKKKDLFDRKMMITTRNIADELTSAAGLIMGERNEKIPAVIVRGWPIKLSNLSAKRLTKKLIISQQQDLFKDILKFK